MSYSTSQPVFWSRIRVKNDISITKSNLKLSLFNLGIFHLWKPIWTTSRGTHLYFITCTTQNVWVIDIFLWTWTKSLQPFLCNIRFSSKNRFLTIEALITRMFQECFLPLLKTVMLYVIIAMLSLRVIFNMLEGIYLTIALPMLSSKKLPPCK